MPKQSAGILLFRIRNKKVEVFLAHPGGPFFKKKDLGVWSIPKGEFDGEEAALQAAKREFKEEIGVDVEGEFIPLKPIKYKSGKIVYTWALKKDIKPSMITCNTFSLEWPPKSGKYIEVPEIDKADWFTLPIAREKIIQAQASLLDELERVAGTK